MPKITGNIQNRTCGRDGAASTLSQTIAWGLRLLRGGGGRASGLYRFGICAALYIIYRNP